MASSRRSVLFVAHSARRGGAEYCLDTTLGHLDRERFEPVVVFPDEGPMADSAREMGVAVTTLPLRQWLYFQKDWWYWKQLALRTSPNVVRLVRLIRARGVELVYTNTSTLFEPALAARLAGVPHVWHVHEVLRPDNRMEQLLPIGWIQRFIRRYSATVVFESQAAREAFEATTPVAHAEVVYNSLRLDVDDEAADAEATRQRLGIRGDDLVLGFVGQFIDRKNPLLLIKALASLSDVPNVVCVFAGEGPLEGDLRRLAAELDVEDRCRFVPFQTDVRPLLKALDVLVLPSRQESFGLVLVEAGTCRKPVVACRSEGPSEIVVDGETGFLVPPDDAVALGEALRQLLASENLRSSMGRAGRERVRELFDPAINTRRLEDVFDAVLAPRVNHLAAVAEG